jgi:hypothetical protein
MAVALALLLSPALAGPTCDHAGTVQAALDDPAGWEQLDETRGVVVSRKVVAELGLTAFKGEVVLPADTDTDRVFELLCDPTSHMSVSDNLAASEVLGADGAVLQFYQVLKKSPMVDQRFWMVHSVIQSDIGGVEGHNKRTWDALAPSLYPTQRAAVSQHFEDATEVTENHGSWELRPRGDGSTLFIYRTVSDPGGAIPDSLFRAVTSRTLPSNMLSFVEAAD